MSRFLIFAFDAYYPNGGINDCRARCGVETDAITRAVALCGQWKYVHVYDVEDNKIVWHSNDACDWGVPSTDDIPAYF